MMEQNATQINYDEIKEYLRNLEFKKSFFGIKEDAVFSSIQKLDEMYRAKIEKLSTEYEAVTAKVSGLEEELAQEKTARVESDEKVAAMETVCADYELKSEQMARMMADIQEMKDTMLDRSRTDADKIMNDAYDIQREEMEKVRAEKEAAKAFRRENISELEAIKQIFKEIYRRAENAQSLIDTSVEKLEEKSSSTLLYLRDAKEN